MELNQLQSSQENPSPKRGAVRYKISRLGPPLWTTISLLSLLINAILIAVLLGIGSQIFSAKKLINEQLLSGLSENFAEMDQASIQTVIPIRDQSVQAQFNLHIDTTTTVVLSEDVAINDATIYDLRAGNLYIYQATTDIKLPAGTELPINLTLDVPVDQQIPVNLDVPVDIPLSQSQLHEPFTGLKEVVDPYILLLDRLPDSWTEVFCGQTPGKVCAWVFKGK